MNSELKIKKSLVLAVVVGSFVGTIHAANIPISIDFSNIKTNGAVINSAKLVDWYNQPALPDHNTNNPPTINWFLTPGQTLPVRSTAGQVANDEHDIWFDQAIFLDYVQPNVSNNYIIVHTNNTKGQPDPANPAKFRAGLVSKDATSTLPLYFKGVPKAALVTAASSPKTATIPIAMPAQVAKGGTCDANDPYNPGQVQNDAARHCDFGTLFFTNGPATDYNNVTAAYYASMINSTGVHLIENQSFLPGEDPSYWMLGLGTAGLTAQPYSGDILIEVVSF